MIAETIWYFVLGFVTLAMASAVAVALYFLCRSLGGYWPIVPAVIVVSYLIGRLMEA